MVVNLTCELVQLDEFTGLKPSICLTCNQTRFCVGPSKLKGACLKLLAISGMNSPGAKNDTSLGPS